VNLPINKSIANIDSIPGMCFQVASWMNPAAATTEYWIDNLKVIITPGPPPPPPTITGQLEPAKVGLNLKATANGANAQWNRYHICTAPTTGYTFVGQSSVTYS